MFKRKLRHADRNKGCGATANEYYNNKRAGYIFTIFIF